MEKTEKTLKEFLTKNNIKYISDFNEFSEKLLDFSIYEKCKAENLPMPNTPEIKTAKKSIIIFDNHDFNETYVIDLFDAVLSYLLKDDCEFKNSETGEIIKTNGYLFLNIDEIDIYYCDNYQTRLKIFNPKIYNILKSIFGNFDIFKEEHIKNIEKLNIVPSIMFFDPNLEDKSINCVFERNLAQISEQMILSVFYSLKDNNVLELMGTGKKEIEM